MSLLHIWPKNNGDGLTKNILHEQLLNPKGEKMVWYKRRESQLCKFNDNTGENRIAGEKAKRCMHGMRSIRNATNNRTKQVVAAPLRSSFVSWRRDEERVSGQRKLFGCLRARTSRKRLLFYQSNYEDLRRQTSDLE